MATQHTMPAARETCPTAQQTSTTAQVVGTAVVATAILIYSLVLTLLGHPLEETLALTTGTVVLCGEGVRRILGGRAGDTR